MRRFVVCRVPLHGITQSGFERCQRRRISAPPFIYAYILCNQIISGELARSCEHGLRRNASQYTWSRRTINREGKHGSVAWLLLYARNPRRSNFTRMSFRRSCPRAAEKRRHRPYCYFPCHPCLRRPRVYDRRRRNDRPDVPGSRSHSD